MTKPHNPLCRNPTQVVNATATNGGGGGQTTATSTPRSSCPCVRSKSMEDMRTEVVNSPTATTDWPTYIKDNFKNLNNGREVPQSTSTAVSTMLSTATKHSNTRRSMDNLLKVDTNYGRPFQVCVCVRVGFYYHEHENLRYLKYKQKKVIFCILSVTLNRM